MGRRDRVITKLDGHDNYSTTWCQLSTVRGGRSNSRDSCHSHTIPSSSWMLSGTPDIVFLRLTFFGRRVRVSEFIRERRTLACLSNVSPGDQLTSTDKQKGQLVTYMQSVHTHTRCHYIFHAEPHTFRTSKQWKNRRNISDFCRFYINLKIHKTRMIYLKSKISWAIKIVEYN